MLSQQKTSKGLQDTVNGPKQNKENTNQISPSYCFFPGKVTKWMLVLYSLSQK